MKWIALVGITCQFLSFWFAAPELLGKAALERFEEGLKKFITALPIILLLLFVLGFALSFGVYGIVTGLQGASEGLSREDFIQFLIVLAIAFSFYIVFLVFFKRIRQWIARNISSPLVTRLIDRSETRQQALIIGAVLFTLGFIIQAVLLVIED